MINKNESLDDENKSKKNKNKLFDDVNKKDLKDMSDLLQKDGSSNDDEDFLNGYGKDEIKLTTTEENIFEEEEDIFKENLEIKESSIENIEKPTIKQEIETIKEESINTSEDISGAETVVSKQTNETINNDVEEKMIEIDKSTSDIDKKIEEPVISNIDEMRKKMAELTPKVNPKKEAPISQNTNNSNTKEGTIMRNFKMLITNSKGGVGKSTTSMQLIAPFLFLKNNNQPIPVYEFDSSVKDSNTFSNSRIAQPQIMSVDGKTINFKLIDLLTRDEMMALDIGNSTSVAVLDSLASSGMIYTIDLFVLPLTDGEKDAEHALILYKKIKQAHSEAKFVFVLNRVHDNRTEEDTSNVLDLQFIEFFGDNQNRFDSREGLIEQISPEDRNIIKLYETDCIKHSRLLYKTIFEIAHINTSKLEEAQKASLISKDFKQLNQLAVKSTIYQKARNYYNEVIKIGLDTIENIIK